MSCKPVTGAQFYMRKYGIGCDDANRLATHPKLHKIIRATEGWREQHGTHASSSLSRGYLLDQLRRGGLAGARRRRRR